MKFIYCILHSCSPLFRKHLTFSILFSFVLCLLFPFSIAIAQGDENLLNRCWSVEQLKGKIKEVRSKRSRHGVLPPQDQSEVSYPLNSNFINKTNPQGTVRWVKLPKGKKYIALTLDLCEAAYEISGYDGGVIDYLRAHKIKATLFLGGKWMDHHSERTQQLIADPLFEIGSHGWSHKNLRKTYGKVLAREISAVRGAYDRAITSLKKKACFAPSQTNFFMTSDLSAQTSHLSRKAAPLQKQLKLFRFPFGTCHKQALKEVYKQGQLPIQWNIVTGDPAFGQSARRIASIIKQRVKPGSIIIAHANGRGRNTAQALPLFIPDLLKKGYQFVTVSELLAAGEPQIAPTCYENRPGDNSHY
ncbi:MAG: polysaccharide deacetylase family protein [Rhizobiales bacterium]|nr:polysaccharide deacetylase family protein [Hyphomicrobiales bacterium]